jgi:hypothetical protein
VVQQCQASNHVRDSIVADAGVYYASVDWRMMLLWGVSRFKLNLFFPVDSILSNRNSIA